MRWVKVALAGMVVAGAVSLASPALAAGTAINSRYFFVLAPADTAVSPSGGMMAAPGDWIRVTGAGSFDPAAQTVAAAGQFVHYNSAGTVVCQGWWKATGFTSFTAFGGNGHGAEGGVLSIVVTHYCTTMGTTMTGIPMTITSTFNAPAGSPSTEGITVCDFTETTGGGVTIVAQH